MSAPSASTSDGSIEPLPASIATGTPSSIAWTKPSEYAREGTIAHSICEVSAKLHFKKIKKTEYNKVLKKYKADPQWDDEMLQTAETYSEHLAERAMGFDNEPYIAFEVMRLLAEIEGGGGQ